MQEYPILRELLIVIAVTIAVVPLVQRLRISPVVGYLAAGMILGPAGLDAFADLEETRKFAEFGVVFLMFAIGLELSLQRLGAMRAEIFGLGAAQVLATGGAILGLLLLTGLALPAAIVLAGSLALSSTAIVLKVLSDRGDLLTRHGRLAFAILLLQDIAVVPLLVVVPLLADADADIGMALSLAVLKGGAMLAAVMLAGGRLIRPVLRRAARSRAPEIFTGSVLLIALGTGWATHWAGLSFALGAFLAGLLVAETEFRHQVEADIEPVRAVMLALFFITIGAVIDLRLIGGRIWTVAGLVVALVLVKAAVLALLCRLARLPAATTIRLALLLAQGGEFAFVLVSMALAAGVLPPEVAAMTVVGVAASMALTPFLAALGRRLATFFARPDAGPAAAAPGAPRRGHVIIAGAGRFGRALSQRLREVGVPHLMIESDPAKVDAGRASGLPVVFGEAVRPEVWLAAGLREARAVAIAIDSERADRVVTFVRALRPDVPVAARARDEDHAVLLQDAGATGVIVESAEPSRQLATLLVDLARTPGA